MRAGMVLGAAAFAAGLMVIQQETLLTWWAPIAFFLAWAAAQKIMGRGILAMLLATWGNAASLRQASRQGIRATPLSQLFRDQRDQKRRGQ